MKIYLSGPMRGISEFNFPRFHQASFRLRLAGHTVYSPAEHDEESVPTLRHEPGFRTGDAEMCHSFDAPSAFAWDFARVLECDAIAMLPGWEKSAGARSERHVAELLNKLVILVSGERLDQFLTDPVQRRMKCPSVNWEVVK